MKKAIITQSNYIPWKGYFDIINHCDVFVVYDDVQYTKRDWRNRNQIKTPIGLKWLTIPVEVSGKYLQNIRDTKIADKKWPIMHWDVLVQNYRNAAHFKEMKEWIEPLYRDCNYNFLSDINIYFITAINDFLGINTHILSSFDFVLAGDKTQRLVNICTDLAATDYYTGPAAKAYLDESKFKDKNILVNYWDYSNYPEYPQLHGPFVHEVSILDLIFNMGSSTLNYL